MNIGFFGFSWVLHNAKQLRDKAREDHRLIDCFRMHPQPLALLKKKMGDAEGKVIEGDIMFYGIPVKPNDFQSKSEVTCKYKWKTLEGIY